MATIKSFTSVEQSRKLAEILPLESVDMVIWGRNLEAVAAKDAQELMKGLKERKMDYLPCWSLAALLGVLDFPGLTQRNENEWEVCMFDHDNDGYIEKIASNPVDACVAMIEKLNGLKML